MEHTVLRAKYLLAEFFNIDVKQFQTNTSRKRSVVEARRFLTYFLVKELDIQYIDVPRFIPALSNHATAIHHCKQMTAFLKVEKPILRKYETFKETLLGDNCASIEKEIGVLLSQRRIITKQINKLKNLIK